MGNKPGKNIVHHCLNTHYIFPRFILYNFFLVLLIYGGGFGFWGWGLILGFQLMAFGACGVGPSWFFGLGSLYKYKRITLGKNGA